MMVMFVSAVLTRATEQVSLAFLWTNTVLQQIIVIRITERYYATNDHSPVWFHSNMVKKKMIWYLD